MALARLLSRAWSIGLDQVLPARCGVCGGYGEFLCEACAAALPAAAGRRCFRCWQVKGVGECARCAEYGCECTAIRAVCVYRDGAKRLVTAVKYRGWSALAPAMAETMAAAWAASGLNVDLVVPVPLHTRRQRERGFNQAALLAREMARLLELPYDATSLLRPHATRAQAGLRVEAERRANVHGAFTWRDDDCGGRRVLVVDDVTTTGSTLGACADALFLAGAEVVYGLAFAIAE